MEKIDFNNDGFIGFTDGEDILVDTGILLAFLSSYDTWHKTVSELFNNHILNNKKVLFLYINPCVLNEVVHLTNIRKCINEYLRKHTEITLSKQEKEDIEKNTINAMKVLVEKEILLPLDGNKDVYLNQMEMYKELGSADAFNASLASEYGISFLTVDNKLVQNINNNISHFDGIDKIYYTTNVHTEY